MLTYTEYERDMELALILTQTFHALTGVLGEEAVLQAFQVAADNPEFRDVYAPGALELDRYPIYASVRRIEAYTLAAPAPDNLDADLLSVQSLVALICTPDRVETWLREAASNADPDPDLSLPGRPDHHEAMGNYYRGILQQLIQLATARRKVDNDEPLTIADIALLTDTKEATVTTAVHRNQLPTYQEGSRRLAAAAEALPWMIERGYQPTQRVDSDSEPPSSAAEDTAEDMTFVPVATDGSFFLPACRMGNGFTIGKKGQELKFDDYYEALRGLTAMPT
ncbi:MAG: hypothetical protein ACREUG_16000, partial [Steroidobacteraceae bacterium]